MLGRNMIPTPVCPEEPSLSIQLRDWYRLPLGERLRVTEEATLADILPDMFGYHLLQVGSMADGMLSSSRILHRAVMAVGQRAAEEAVGLCGEPERLPVTADSLDALILYHTLEFSPDPHQVLREAERVLVAEGHIVVLGFNPFSLWGLRKVVPLRRRGMPWCGRFLSLPRLRDWLSLLGFETVSVRQLFRRPPLQRAGALERFRFLERLNRPWLSLPGGVYMVVARKKVMTMTPIKPRWRPRRSLVSGLADSASRNVAARNPQSRA